jgi:hypothetical protein
MAGQQQPARRNAASVIGPLIVANAGVLVVFGFGPNAPHPILPLAYVGVVVAGAGAIALIRALTLRRAANDSPNVRTR